MREILTRHWGDLASILGLLVSVGGFWVTIVGVRKAKNAAQQAREAAASAKRSIMTANALVDFASAMGMMEEIRRLHRERAWKILPDRYAALKAALISLRAEHPNLSLENQTAITTSLAQLRSIEQRVEKALEMETHPEGIAKMNAVLSRQIENISEVLVSLQKEITSE